MKCNHLVYHPQFGTEEWKQLLETFRLACDRGDTLVPIIAEQLFGSCETSTYPVVV